MTALEEVYPLGPIHHLADLYLPQMFTDLHHYYSKSNCQNKLSLNIMNISLHTHRLKEVIFSKQKVITANK